MDNQELISALADGQLEGEAFARGVALAASDPQGRETWWSYHLVGEALRTGSVCAGSAPDAFLARLQRRLKEEGASPMAAAAPAQIVVAPVRSQPAANDWRWKITAGVASVAAVAAVGWNVWGSAGVRPGQPQLAAAPAAQPAMAEASAAPMLRDPRLDRLLAAHRQFGGGNALGGSGFLRNATFEGPAR